jgi:hypothetical protein
MTTRAAGEQRQFQKQYREALDRVVELQSERFRVHAAARRVVNNYQGIEVYALAKAMGYKRRAPRAPGGE